MANDKKVTLDTETALATQIAGVEFPAAAQVAPAQANMLTQILTAIFAALGINVGAALAQTPSSPDTPVDSKAPEERWSYLTGQVGGVFKVESCFNNHAAIA